jgi:hypothetical protein
MRTLLKTGAAWSVKSVDDRSDVTKVAGSSPDSFA